MLILYLCIYFFPFLNNQIINSSSLEQKSKTSNFGSGLVLCQKALDLFAEFMEMKSLNPKSKPDQQAIELGCSTSTLQPYTNDINMLLPCKIASNGHNRTQNISNTNLNDNSLCDRELKRPQMTSKNFKRPQMNLLPTRERN